MILSQTSMRPGRAVPFGRPQAACAHDGDPVDLVKIGQPRVASTRGLARTGEETARKVAGSILSGLKTGFVQAYMDPQQVYQRARELAASYPHLIQLVESPLRTEGYDGSRVDLRGPAPLYHLRIGPRDDPDRDRKTGVVHLAAPHAREHCQPVGMLELVEQLVANYDPESTDPAIRANTELVRNLDIFVLPCTNPDGTNYSFYDDRDWRKNRSREEGGIGVDANRNYPFNFETRRDYDSETYAGPEPLSEVETRHIVSVVDEHPNILYLCDWHSYAEEIRRPWGVSKQDKPIYDRMHRHMREAIESVRGRRYQTVVSKVARGTSDDYFYHQRRIFATVVEDAREFQPAWEEASQVVQEIAAGARGLLQFALNSSRMGVLSAAPPARVPTLTPEE
ncbi:MAG: M14 family metallopeptidase [Candidatus Eremiobacterota bacterium]